LAPLFFMGIEMKNFIWIAAFLVLSACYTAPSHAYPLRATWYATGHHTANGERFKPDGRTAAHRSLPFGTVLCVSLGNKMVKVRVNDRGPAKYTGNGLDLSRGAAKAIGLHRVGRATVNVIQGCNK
jgi:rare lipoprotein A